MGQGYEAGVDDITKILTAVSVTLLHGYIKAKVPTEYLQIDTLKVLCRYCAVILKYTWNDDAGHQNLDVGSMFARSTHIFTIHPHFFFFCCGKIYL